MKLSRKIKKEKRQKDLYEYMVARAFFAKTDSVAQPISLFFFGVSFVSILVFHPSENEKGRENVSKMKRRQKITVVHFFHPHFEKSTDSTRESSPFTVPTSVSFVAVVDSIDDR